MSLSLSVFLQREMKDKGRKKEPIVVCDNATRCERNTSSTSIKTICSDSKSKSRWDNGSSPSCGLAQPRRSTQDDEARQALSESSPSRFQQTSTETGSRSRKRMRRRINRESNGRKGPSKNGLLPCGQERRCRQAARHSPPGGHTKTRIPVKVITMN